MNILYESIRLITCQIRLSGVHFFLTVFAILTLQCALRKTGKNINNSQCSIVKKPGAIDQTREFLLNVSCETTDVSPTLLLLNLTFLHL